MSADPRSVEFLVAEPMGRSGDVTDWEQDIRTGEAHYLQGVHVSLPQSGLGIAALGFSSGGGVILLLALLAAAKLVADPSVDGSDPRILLMGFGFLAGMVLAMLAAILGLVGLFQPDRSRTCAVGGLVLSGLQLSVLGLMILFAVAGAALPMNR